MGRVERSGDPRRAAVGLPFGRGAELAGRGAWVVAGLDAERPTGLEVGAGAREGWRDRVLVAPDGLVWDDLTDVLVVGSGVAGLVAALTAREAGVEVVVVAGPDAARQGEGLATGEGDGRRDLFDGPALVLPAVAPGGPASGPLSGAATRSAYARSPVSASAAGRTGKRVTSGGPAQAPDHAHAPARTARTHGIAHASARVRPDLSCDRPAC